MQQVGSVNGVFLNAKQNSDKTTNPPKYMHSFKYKWQLAD